MKVRSSIVVAANVALLAIQVAGQTPVITSFQGNGRLTWTNPSNSTALFRVEWAAQAAGPWHSFTYQPITLIDAHNGTNFTVEVPMFYRVVAATNPPPVGMVWIDAGDVELGQESIGGDAVPVHTNFISGFWMDATEVTKAQWDDVATWAASNGYDIAAAGGSGKTNNHPVQNVTWYECVKWCNARSQKEGLAPCYYIDPIHFNLYKTGDFNISNSWVNWTSTGYRLPTEAEWEKAARGGRQRRLFAWGGDTIQHVRANYAAATNTYAYDTSPTSSFHPNYQTGGLPYTSPVGSFAANGYGLHDMAGNVFEWCWDWYAPYSAAHATDPHGADTGTNRVMRSGSWGSPALWSRCAQRSGLDGAGTSQNNRGFRCVKGS